MATPTKNELLDTLTPKERSILFNLGIGASHEKVIGDAKITAEALPSHCYNIRQKTGIADTSDPVECRSFWRAAQQEAPPKAKKPPTPTERRVLEMVAAGIKPKAIATRLAIIPQSVYNALNLGSQRIGVHGRGEARRLAIRAWLDAQTAPAAPVTTRDHTPDPMADPMF